MILDFALPPELAAHEPPEARGLGRDAVRLLVGSPAGVSHHRFTDLPALLAAGDVLVVNTSGTLPAAVDLADGRTVHFSTELSDGSWVVELRRGADPAPDGVSGERLTLPGGAGLILLRRYSPDRLWVGSIGVESVPSYLARYGRPIRYGYVPREWPISAYQTVFGIDPGSAEMPSAARPFSEALVTRLVATGVVFAPITLHTGVASAEAHEKPYPERFFVPATTARLVNQARAAGSRIVAVGTTAVRALESAAAPDGTVTPAAGWTDLVVTPERGVRAVDGLLTGFHEARASHLLMLSAIAGPDLLADCYREALAGGYLWHEFGDVNLILS